MIIIFLQLDQYLSTFGKKCIFPFENPKTLRKILKNWCWTFKMSGTLLKMMAILQKMMDAPCKMLATPCIMLAATHFMFVKDQRGGGLEGPPGPPPPYPLSDKYHYFFWNPSRRNKKYVAFNFKIGSNFIHKYLCDFIY